MAPGSADLAIFKPPRARVLVTWLGWLALWSLYAGALLEYGHGLPASFVVASLWAVGFGRISLGHLHEVAVGREFMSVRSWWDILRRRPRSNEFVSPEDVWLVRRRNGAWLLRPASRVFELGNGDWQPLAQTLEAAGLKVTDRRRVWEEQHRSLHRAEQVADALVPALVVSMLPAEMLGIPDLIWLIVPGVLGASAFSWAIVRFSSLPQPAAGVTSLTASPAGSGRSRSRRG